MPKSRRRRLLSNETLFREINDAVQIYYLKDGVSHADFVCECSDRSCVAKITLSREEYGSVRLHPTRFFVVPGHELGELERTVQENSVFTVVQKPVVP